MSVTPIGPPPGGPGGAQEAPKSSNTLLIVIIVAVLLVGCCGVGGIIAAIAIPNLVQARQGSNEAAAIGALRTLTTGQALFREGDKDRNNVLDYASSLRQLQSAYLIDGVLGSGTKQGYLFRIEAADERSWSATATPLTPGKSGGRSFFVDETGEIRWRDASRGAATVRDQSLSDFYGGR